VAVKEWRRESRELAEMGVLTMADAGALAMRCYLAHQIQDLVLEIQKEGRVLEIKGFNKSYEEIVLMTRTNPKCVQLNKCLSEYRAIGTIFGLDPSGRSRLKADPKKPASKFDGLMGAALAKRQ
jgi:P27 family predicted phage terminase small subunit